VLSSPGTLNFNSDGSLNTTSITSPVAVNVSNLADGASDLSIDWNLESGSGAGTITQYSETSSLATKDVDGAAASQLSQISIGNGGQIVATFTNGQQKVEGQVALAAIQNPQSLQNAGNNNYSATGATAQPAIGMPQSGGRGQILGSSLESSNVDMASEFTNLIVYQRGYQASSRVITTADQMGEDLLNLIH
jgi:flagellar hook protein FlgE